jgi:hypothetical protein
MWKFVIPASLAFAVGAALAAQVPPPRPPDDPNPPRTLPQDPTTSQSTAAPQARKAKQVLGSKVSLQGGVNIGTVDDIIFSDAGHVDYLVVLNEGKYVIVPWQAAKFDFQKQTASVNITQAQYREVPTFTTQQWPNVYEPAYMTRIYRYYNIQPPDRYRPILDRRDIRRDNRRDP